MQRLVEKLIEERLDESVFTKRYPFSALLFAVDKKTLESTTSLEIKNVKPDLLSSNLSQTTFDTLPLAKASSLPLLDKEELPSPSVARAAFLTKSGRNKKPVLTLGRGRDNDIVIEMATVSKYHAFFLQGDDGTWYLCDTSSTNGTKVDDLQLEPNEQRPLSDNALITFGQTVSCRFFTPEGLWNFLKYFEGMNQQLTNFLDAPG